MVVSNFYSDPNCSNLALDLSGSCTWLFTHMFKIKQLVFWYIRIFRTTQNQTQAASSGTFICIHTKWWFWSGARDWLILAQSALHEQVQLIQPKSHSQRLQKSSEIARISNLISYMHWICFKINKWNKQAANIYGFLAFWFRTKKGFAPFHKGWLSGLEG